MIPRDYQQAAIDAIWQYFLNGHDGNPVVAMPTGTGKSIVIGGFAKGVLHAYPNQRIMVLTHVKELIEQNLDKLITMWPSAPAGVYSAGLGRKDSDAPIIFAGIQSAVGNPTQFGHIDLLVIDECHLVSTKDTTSYQKFIRMLKDVNPNLKVIGLSATPYRLGQGMITDGGLFTDVCFDLTTLQAFNWLLQEGYLSPLIPKRTTLELNLDEVRIQGGEFVNRDLQAAVDKDEITYKAVLETMEYGYDRRCWLLFATGIDHAKHIADVLNTHGVPTACVHSKMGDKERDRILADFKAGLYQAVVNNNILTTGFDLPEIDLIAVLRPTNSPGLWVQMLGRGTRPVYHWGFDLTTTEGRLSAISAGVKQNCLVLDFAGNTKRLGPINDPVLPKKKGAKKGTAPVRLCEGCNTYIHASLRNCTNCGMEFPIHVKFGFTAGTDELIAESKPQVEVFPVDKVVYQLHLKEGRPDAIKVGYHCGLRLFWAFVCLEHGGFAAKKGRAWWRAAWPSETRGELIPDTTDAALEMVEHLKEPASISVWLNKKYPEILEYEY